MCTNLFQVNIISQFHILGVNLQNFQSASSIRNTNIHFSIKTPCRDLKYFLVMMKHQKNKKDE